MTQTDHAKEKQHKSSAARVKAYRARQKAKGLRPITIWVPDSPEFIAEARRQSEVLANSAHEAEIMAWIEAVTEGVYDNDPWTSPL
jgi:hypothetical protein